MADWQRQFEDRLQTRPFTFRSFLPNRKFPAQFWPGFGPRITFVLSPARLIRSSSALAL